MRKLELREVKSLAQGHRSSEQSWAWTWESEEAGNTHGREGSGCSERTEPGQAQEGQVRKASVMPPPSPAVERRGMGELRGVGGARTRRALNAGPEASYFSCGAGASGQLAGPPTPARFSWQGENHLSGLATPSEMGDGWVPGWTAGVCPAESI